MSSRALRKAQREREAQEQLARLEQEAQELSEEDALPTAPAKKSAFAMLGEAEDDADEADGAHVQQEEEEDNESQEPVTTSIPKPSTKKKRKKKKGKPNGGGSLTPAENDEQLDEIDQALKQLSTNGDASLPGTTAAGIDSTTEETSNLLAIDTNHLHAQNEMRRLFGRAALEQQDDDQPPPQANIGANRRQQRRVRQLGLAQALRGHGAQGGRAGGLAAMALRRNIFIQGKDEWPIATGGGLGMEVEEKKADGTVLYRFIHNRTYQDVQAQFQIAVDSMDPEQLVVLLQQNPYHISTLLQVSEMAKQERDHATSGDLLERALFSFGRAAHSTFARTLAEGKARLDFRRPENREFWLASWRYMQNLSMRATWRTVYEWAKLLLSLSPEEDPYAIWLVLDQYALRARQDLDFLNLSRNPTLKTVHQNMPNVQLSQGLAEFRAGNKRKGQQALFTAIGRFPWVVARLLQELGLDAPPAIWGKEPRTEKEKLYSELYATRAKDLWNTPENSALLVEVASALPPDTMPVASVDEEGEVESMNVARHVILSDTPALIALVPRRFTNALGSESDPLPPGDSYESYLPADLTRSADRVGGGGGGEGTAVDNLRELHGLYGFFSNLFPWFNRDGSETGVEPTAEEMIWRIQDSGVDEEVIVDRTRRMIELQNRLRGDFGAGRFQFAPESGDDEDAPEAGEEEEGESRRERQPRVEDVEDAGD